MATIKDVSKLAQVSISTVSRVVNGTAQVAPEKHAAVIKAMAELDYQPNSFAQALVSKRSDCIGLVVGDIGGGPFFMEMMSGVDEAVQQAGKYSMVMAGSHLADKERQAIRMLMQRQCDAIIVHSMGLSDEELIELSKSSTPLVFINRLVPGLEGQCIYLDNQTGFKDATEHLIEQGHKDIAFITTSELDFVDGHRRMDGFKSALAAANLNFNQDLVSRSFPNEFGGRIAMQQLMGKRDQFTAIVGYNDSMIVGALSYLLENQIKVPEQISLIGFDDNNYAQFVYPTLTTMQYPVEAMGKRAAQLAMDLFLAKTDEHKVDRSQLVFKAPLVERNSVKNNK